jgi:hypothetical protein
MRQRFANPQVNTLEYHIGGSNTPYLNIMSPLL